MEREQRRLATIFSHLSPSRQLSQHRRLGSLEPSAASSENGADSSSCVFCKVARGESAAVKLYEDDMCMCILDSNPLTNGHSLIITKSHYPSLDATPPHLGHM
ncbi:adenylylsulfatase HINT3-like isoform X2 [Asparagus officinalis]|uniref:adenylylsulfatase HINT3-like isoform X1 n=1 Tax=Asparagus officinalis TaxID=4686 RepID=UPI00098E47A8|nr:adenylylsulfatase HINT3-like isoform X1 [Asparagus officinalis]XP_020268327.1 adenylylsulfatase HINT3-like isoform X2 [Asparagus officinalis]